MNKKELLSKIDALEREVLSLKQRIAFLETRRRFLPPAEPVGKVFTAKSSDSPSIPRGHKHVFDYDPNSTAAGVFDPTYRPWSRTWGCGTMSQESRRKAIAFLTKR